VNILRKPINFSKKVVFKLKTLPKRVSQFGSVSHVGCISKLQSVSRRQQNGEILPGCIKTRKLFRGEIFTPEKCTAELIQANLSKVENGS
jgi:hypothetical protein